MEESNEVHEEDKGHAENSKKRTLKTPSQIEALENLYNEHKYPNESLKSQLAEDIGLSEKQVSGWFCHRRLKDKNMLKDETHGIGRQDLSSGTIQDRCSALKQDSCSSTMPGEYKYFEPREVESRRFCGKYSPTEDLTYRNRGQYMHVRNYSTMENTSSGSSSASQERMHSKDPYDMEHLKYSSQSRNYSLTNVKDLKPRQHMIGSDYLNSQEEIGNAAILAVKRQLGRLYREDGPPLGVKFELLPPSAFDAPIEDSTNGPYYVGDSVKQNSVGVLKVHNEPIFDTGYTKFSRGKHPHGSYTEGDLKRVRLDPNHHDYISYQSLGKSSLTNCRSYGPCQNSSVKNVDANPAVVASNKNRKHGIRPKHSVEGMKSEYNINHFPHSYKKKIATSGSSTPRLHKSDGPGSQMLQTGSYLNGRKSRENANLVGVKMQQPNKRKAKQSDGHMPLDYVSKTPSPPAMYLPENQIKGYAGEIPTSFSDDETAATSSSVD
ncbi:Homeobox-ddt domain protein rlt1 [Thalictrum thalictroides]|uniref:Homeobox-ddt domain protein rlt1 n=1 Tax=Thalictrum thalictroides TaxID=46969 RepID=A0A7J6VEC7_THATH|nr:Homeobox-ddt domain protein rlt1 [Thalictrum thalictroides]